MPGAIPVSSGSGEARAEPEAQRMPSLTAADRLRLEDDLAKLDAALARFATVTQHKSTWRIAATFAARGGVLVRLGRYEEGLSVCDQVLSRYGQRTEPPMLVLVAGALLQRGIALGALGRWAQARACLDELVARFASASSDVPDLADVVDAARRLRDDTRSSGLPR